jgi:hypothetical protein
VINRPPIPCGYIIFFTQRARNRTTNRELLQVMCKIYLNFSVLLTSTKRTKVFSSLNKIFDISLEIQHELGKDNTSQNNSVQMIKSLYILYRRIFASFQHTFLTCVVYTSLISGNVQRYSQIKIVIRIYLVITRLLRFI